MTTLLFLILCQVPGSPSEAAIIVDETKQLFLDDFLIASSENITRRVHPVRKHAANPLSWPQESWEGTIALVYGSVIRDGEKYRMWYLSSPGMSYAESVDGIAWTKPSLGLFRSCDPRHGCRVCLRVLDISDTGVAGVGDSDHCDCYCRVHACDPRFCRHVHGGPGHGQGAALGLSQLRFLLSTYAMILPESMGRRRHCSAYRLAGDPS